MKIAAYNYYMAKKGNCAQAVSAAWNEHTGQTGELGEYGNFGRGKAPDGVCGALYAACAIAGNTHTEVIQRRFAELSGGHIRCGDIRRSGSMSCAECVMHAADLLDKIPKEGECI